MRVRKIPECLLHLFWLVMPAVVEILQLLRLDRSSPHLHRHAVRDRLNAVEDLLRYIQPPLPGLGKQELLDFLS